jgi:5-methylcytosine-specific restriction endonuclease McrA
MPHLLHINIKGIRVVQEIVKNRKRLSREVRKSIVKQQGWTCANSPKSFFSKKYDYTCPLWKDKFRWGKIQRMDEIELDHIVPLYTRGPDDIENLQALCSLCHRIKTNTDNRYRHWCLDLHKYINFDLDFNLKSNLYISTANQNERHKILLPISQNIFYDINEDDLFIDVSNLVQSPIQCEKRISFKKKLKWYYWMKHKYWETKDPDIANMTKRKNICEINTNMITLPESEENQIEGKTEKLESSLGSSIGTEIEPKMLSKILTNIVHSGEQSFYFNNSGIHDKKYICHIPLWIYINAVCKVKGLYYPHYTHFSI